MTAKLFRTSLAMALAVMVLSIGLFMGMLYQYFSDQLMEELENETRLVSQGVELEGMAYLDGLRSVNRVTWVAADGTVLFDNEADPAEMENHADREEIREAMDSETGTAQRYSSTLSEQTLYVTRRLDDGSVIRLASAQKTVGLLLISMVQPILVILVLSLLLAAVLSSRLAKGIIRPILALDLEHPEDCETYEELTPLLSRLKRQNDTIQQQMDLLRQRQTEFAALTDNMSEGFLLLDRQGHVLSHNSGALRLLGAEEPEGEVNALVLNRDEPFRQAVDEVLSGRRSQQLLHLNGRYCRLLANPVLDGGEPAGAVLVLLDVTEQEQREELRREFTANVSHELKTPLAGVHRQRLPRAEDPPHLHLRHCRDHAQRHGEAPGHPELCRRHLSGGPPAYRPGGGHHPPVPAGRGGGDPGAGGRESAHPGPGCGPPPGPRRPEGGGDPEGHGALGGSQRHSQRAG